MNKHLKVPPHVAEAVLVHVVGSQIARIYNVSDFLDERRAALEKWAAHVLALTGERQSATILKP
jgi:hypothetical protein